MAQVASGGRTRQELVAAGGMRKRELLVAARARCMACMLRSIGFPIVQCIIGVFLFERSCHCYTTPHRFLTFVVAIVWLGTSDGISCRFNSRGTEGGGWRVGRRGTIRSKSCTVFGELYFVRFSLISKIDGGGAQYIRWGSPHPLG